MFSSKSIAFSLLFISLGALASPMRSQPRSRRQEASGSCFPQFNGASVSVTNSAVELGTPAFAIGQPVTAKSSRVGMLAKTDWLFTPNTCTASFSISDKEHTDLVITIDPPSEDDVQRLSLAAPTNNNTQQFEVRCQECSDFATATAQAATGCNIVSVARKQCVQTSQNGADRVFLADCSGSDPQNFDMWVAFAG